MSGNLDHGMRFEWHRLNLFLVREAAVKCKQYVIVIHRRGGDVLQALCRP
jgi:hypothetical protein